MNYFKVRHPKVERETKHRDEFISEAAWKRSIAERVARITSDPPLPITTPLMFFTEANIRPAWEKALAAANGDTDRISVWRQPETMGLWRNVREIGQSPPDSEWATA